MVDGPSMCRALGPGGRVDRVAWAVCGPGAPQQTWQVAEASGGTLGNPLGPLGGARRTFVTRGWVEVAGSPGLPLPLGVANHCSRDSALRQSGLFHCPAAPSLERCAPLDGMQLLKETLV